MIGSYLTAAIRALQRDKFHAALNVFGLAVALAATLLIALYIQHELSYESFFTEPDRVHRVETTYRPNGQPDIKLSGSPYRLTETLNAAFKEQLIATSLRGQEAIVGVGDRHLRASAFFAENNLFDVLDFPVAYGDAAASLQTADEVILTESKARQLFGEENAVGRALSIDNEEVRVGAVLSDLPANTHLDFDILLSNEAPAYDIADWRRKSWNAISHLTFVRMVGEMTGQELEARMPDFIDRRVPAEQITPDNLNFTVRPLPDIHLQAGQGLVPDNRNAVAVGALALAAVLLVIIACLNYINLATARAILRTKEVSMRKIVGASTGQLVVQFLGETLMTTLAAFTIAVALAAVSLPVFVNLVNRELTLATAMTPDFLLVTAGLLVFVSLASGAYPAFVMASFQPTRLFSKQGGTAGGRGTLRNIMVTGQFSLTVGLIIVAAVVFAQVRHLQTLDLGFRKEGVLIVDTPDNDSRTETLRQELARSANFAAAATSYGTPDASYEWNTALRPAGTDKTQTQQAQVVYVGERFFEVYGVAPMVGRTFSENRDIETPFNPDVEKSAPAAAILSESAVPYFGFASTEAALGKEMLAVEQSDRRFRIIGVVPDIHFRLGRQRIKPMVYYFAQDGDQVSARVAGGDVQAAVRELSQIWSQLYPDRPLDHTFLEDRIATANADEARQSQLFAFFTGLAIVIACLGLFGLASFAAVRRTQEIAIRKVLGASTADVTRLLLWDFAKPVLLANLVAWPAAWLLMRRWLEGYAYRIELSPAFFLGASALALAVALITVFARTWRTAQIRPATALKYE